MTKKKVKNTIAIRIKTLEVLYKSLCTVMENIENKIKDLNNRSAILDSVLAKLEKRLEEYDKHIVFYPEGWQYKPKPLHDIVDEQPEPEVSGLPEAINEGGYDG